MNATIEHALPQFHVTFDGREYIGEVAKVESFHLGFEDHGVFTAQVMFVGAGWGQGLPAPCLDEYDKETKARRAGGFAGRYIYALVNQIGSPEQAVGRRVVVFRAVNGKSTGWANEISGFAALNDDGSYQEPFFTHLIPIEDMA